MSTPDGPSAPKWVFWSTRESIEKEIPSATAIIETILAIPAYWWIAIYFETYLPLLVSAAVAPLVLLRSDQSVVLGVRWFRWWSRFLLDEQNKYRDLNPRKRLLVWVISALAFSIAIIVTDLLAAHFLARFEGWPAFWAGFITIWLLIGGTIAALGAATALISGLSWSESGEMIMGLMVGVTVLVIGIEGSSWAAIAGVLVGAAAGLGLGPTALLISLIIRVGATLRYLGPGLRTLPRNFRRLILCISPAQEPELVPGLSKDDEIFTLSSLWTVMSEHRKSSKAREKIFAFGLWPLLMLIWFLPGWLYRVTLKSTAWFWWPLAFLGGDLRRAKDPDEFHRTTIGSLWAKTSIALAGATIIGFIWLNFVRSGAISKDNPLLVTIGYFLVVDWSLLPWQLLSVALAGLSVAIVFLVNDAGGQYRLAVKNHNAALVAKSERKFCGIEYLARLRLVLFLLFWLIVAGHTLLYFNSLKCWFGVPANVDAWARWTYGDRTPPSCREQSSSPPPINTASP